MTQPKAVRAAIRAECRAVEALLVRKNSQYGNSALDPVRVFSRASVDEQLRVRLDDKLSRLARGDAAGEDVELDLLGYLILLRVGRRLRTTRSERLAQLAHARACSAARATKRRKS